MDYFIIIEGNPILNLISSCACGSQPKDFSIFPSTLSSFKQAYLAGNCGLENLSNGKRKISFLCNVLTLTSMPPEELSFVKPCATFGIIIIIIIIINNITIIIIIIIY